MTHAPQPSSTWKVWGPDTTDTLTESQDEDVARDAARTMTLAGCLVILESPDGIEQAYRDGRWLRV